MAIGSDDLTAAQKMTVLGFGASSPRYWWSAAAMQAARIRCLQEDFAAILAASDRGTPVPAVGGVDARLYYPHAIGVEAHFFVSALRRFLRLARTYREFTGDARIPDPEAEFAHLVGRPVDFANIVEHLDAYSIGEGKLQRPTTNDARRFDGLIEGLFVEFGEPLDPHGEIELRVAG